MDKMFATTVGYCIQIVDRLNKTNKIVIFHSAFKARKYIDALMEVWDEDKNRKAYEEVTPKSCLEWGSFVCTDKDDNVIFYATLRSAEIADDEI